MAPKAPEGEQVLLPQVGGAPLGDDAQSAPAAATAAPAGRSPGDRAMTPAFLASHHGVLENSGPGSRGRAAHAGRASREEGRSRERSRRSDRPRKPDEILVPDPQAEAKKPKLEHPTLEPQDELMEARSKALSPLRSNADVYDLTQADHDSENEELRQPPKDKAPYLSDVNIYAPTPGIVGGVGAPTTPLDQLIGDAHKQNGGAVPPPWISDLMDSMAVLHNKQDRTHQDVLEWGREIAGHSVRLETLETGLKEHSDKHESSESRISALERQVRELQTAQPRSPTPSRGRGSRTPPRSPRSPHFAAAPGNNLDETDDLQIVIGGGRMLERAMPLRKLSTCSRTLGMREVLRTCGRPLRALTSSG